MKKIIGLIALLTSFYAYSFSSAPATEVADDKATENTASGLHVKFKAGVQRVIAAQELTDEVMEKLETELVSISTLELCPETFRCSIHFFPASESMANPDSLRLLSNSIKMLSINEKIYSITVQ